MADKIFEKGYVFSIVQAVETLFEVPLLMHCFVCYKPSNPTNITFLKTFTINWGVCIPGCIVRIGVLKLLKIPHFEVILHLHEKDEKL